MKLGQNLAIVEPEQWVPRRDMVATDGQKLTLGDTTLTMYLTPGHTLGTISTLIPVKDNGTPLTVAFPGGTEFKFVNDVPHFDTYISSQRKMGELAAKENATIVMSNAAWPACIELSGSTRIQLQNSGGIGATSHADGIEVVEDRQVEHEAAVVIAEQVEDLTEEVVNDAGITPQRGLDVLVRVCAASQ